MQLLAQLQEALGAAYVVERELGGGGMSRVFVAKEVALGRRVVVKVLPPETAQSLDFERFRREVLVAANLQHPHIVPVFTAGGTGAVTHFTMQFVEGETLRARLQRPEAMSLREVVDAIRDIARALDYAHERGVIHRDIKPDNIFLTGGIAVVADFGIAKAMSVSRTAAPLAPLTATGEATGTPLYMSPEQIAGDPKLGPAADLYALGCVAFEMLVGTPPFRGSTPGALFAAHLRDAPPALATRREDAPSALAALVDQCLRKSASERPASAREFLERCDEIAATLTPVRGTTPAAHVPVRQRAWALAAALAVVALAALGGVTAYARSRGLLASGALADSALILVTDFQAHGPDSIFGPVASEGIREALKRSNRVRLVQTSSVLAALDRMQRPNTLPLDLATARELAAREGYAAIVDGELRSVSGELLLRLNLVAARTGDVLASVHATAGSANELLTALDGAGRELRTRIGESFRDLRGDPPLARVMTPNVEALRLYTEGTRWFDFEGRGLAAAEPLQQAIALDSSFAMAYRKLALVFGQQDSTAARAAEVLTRGYALRGTMPEAERLAFEGVYHWWGPDPDGRRVARAYEELFERFPEWIRIISPDLLAEQYFLQRRYAEAESLWHVSMRELPDEFSPWIDVVRAQLAQGKFRDAHAQVAVLQRRGHDARLVEHLVLAGEGRFDDAREVLRSALTRPRASQAAATYLATDALRRGQLGLWASYVARARTSPSHPDTARSLVAYFFVRYENAELDAALIALRLRDDQRGARAALARWLDSASLAGLVPAQRARRIYVASAVESEMGNTAGARALLAEHASLLGDSLIQKRMRVARVRAEAWIALAEGRYLPAVALFRSARVTPGIPSECSTCEDVEIGEAFVRAGMPDSAIVAFEHFLQTPRSNRTIEDRFDRPQALRRLGELYEAKGDHRRARSYYLEFVEGWKDADPELQPQVRAIRARLDALSGESTAVRRP